MLGLDKFLEPWKRLRGSISQSFEVKDILENSGLVKKMDMFYNLPMTQDEVYLTINSTIDEGEIRDLQFRLKRKLSYSELQILKLTSDHGIMIKENDFKP